MAFTANVVGITGSRGIGTLTAYQIARSALQAQMITDLNNVFFNNTEFSESISYTHYNLGETKTYKVIYDDPTQTITAGISADKIVLKPQIMISLSHMVQYPGMQDVIKVKGIDYMIEEIENDGVGVLTLYLYRKSGARE